SDPKDNPDAVKFSEISIAEVVEKGLGVVDGAAAVIAKENKMPMLVFGLNGENSIINAANGKIDGTVVTV
ncbi:MAG: UMP kinase, partial [Eubacteriales bacterium]